MGESITNVGAITLFVQDPQRSKEFYERVFGASTLYEDENAAAFGFENMVVNTLRRQEADELIAPAAVAEAGSAASFQLSVGVDDADAVCAELAGRGVDFLNGPVDRPWGLRTAAFADPDGHIWEIASELPAPVGA
jgi:catechol 2,3-dioxygenase-like lactoylglutathione lyase family enzyme